MLLPTRLPALLLTLLLALALAVGGTAWGYANGGAQGGEEWAQGALAEGCNCHGAAASEAVSYRLEGFPARYEPDRTYNLTFALADGTDNQGGGFLARVTNGSFVAADGYWVSEAGRLVSHTADTDGQRNWSVQWVAPAAGSGDALLKVIFNGVDGDGSSGGDGWNSVTLVSLGTPQEVSHEVSIHELGVPLKAYWLGLMGIGAVLLTCLIAYFVIRGGSRHYIG